MVAGGGAGAVLGQHGPRRRPCVQPGRVGEWQRTGLVASAAVGGAALGMVGAAWVGVRVRDGWVVVWWVVVRCRVLLTVRRLPALPLRVAMTPALDGDPAEVAAPCQAQGGGIIPHRAE
jgi:hypothetical protein